MSGKNKCKILKEIRQKIADENDIAYVTSECKYQGECSGTCPKCEAEVRQLEKALERRAALGKTVAVAGIAAGLSLSVTGCLDMFRPTAGDPEPPPGGAPLYEETTETETPVPPGAAEELHTEISEGEMIPIPGEEPEAETESESEWQEDVDGEYVEFEGVLLVGDVVIED